MTIVSSNSGSVCNKIARYNRKVRVTLPVDSNVQWITVVTASVQSIPHCPLSDEVIIVIPCCSLLRTIARPSTNHTGVPVDPLHHCHVACNTCSLWMNAGVSLQEHIAQPLQHYRQHPGAEAKVNQHVGQQCEPVGQYRVAHRLLCLGISAAAA